VVKSIPVGAVLWEFLRYKPYDFKKTGSDRDKNGPARYLAFAINHSGDVVIKDLGEAEAIESQIYAARDLIYEHKGKGIIFTDQVVDSEKQLNKVTKKLYDVLFAPLVSHLRDSTEILISADGQLNILPFEILPCPDGRYVVENYSISYLSSGRDLLRFKMKQEPCDWALLVADPAFDLSGDALDQYKNKHADRSSVTQLSHTPSRSVSGCLNFCCYSLPNSLKESEAIREILETQAHLRTECYYGGDALEDLLKDLPTAPKLLHLATHGFFCPLEDPAQERTFENPLLRCGLLLTGANHLRNDPLSKNYQREDGILTAFEASGLNLAGTELVTLSACETGMGDVRNGEGVYGLRRAFQHAGARTIVMSLWKVGDKETRRLMESFYRNWSNGYTKKEALRQAILEVLDDHRGKYAAHPYFWGAFIMLGDPN